MRTKTALIGSGCALLAVAAGCSGPLGQPAPATTHTVTVTPAKVAAPPVPRPAKEADCPYLDSDTVAFTNGQRVGQVRISAGQPPACFFYRYDGRQQMSVWVYRGTSRVAEAIIDRAAPVATSNKATEPRGWTGGSQRTGSGAVYAVLSGGDAVVVTTNQHQTIKAREIATDVIKTLRLS